MVAVRMLMGGIVMPMTLVNIALVWSMGQPITFHIQGTRDVYTSGLITGIRLESGYAASQAPKHFLVDLRLTPVFTEEEVGTAEVYVKVS